MDALMGMRAARAADLAEEMGKYADEHERAGDDELALAATEASEGMRKYAEALSAR